MVENMEANREEQKKSSGLKITETFIHRNHNSPFKS